ncbi:MAG TPA: enoyl-CoA hydratase-related protein, partial [Longimicrobiales bacterium]
DLLVLGAEGENFSAGASVEEHLPPDYKAMIPEFMETVLQLLHFPIPVVAAVQGRCLGGGFELAMAADIVLAAESAVLGVPEIKLGVLPPAACAHLPFLTSRGEAAVLVFSGTAIDPHSAQRAGLVWRVVADGNLEGEALALAEKIARHSSASLRMTKKALRAATPGVDDAMKKAADIYTKELMATEDAVEGLRAFIEKRPPTWRDR